MDGERFDRLTRGMLNGASRRNLLAGLLGGAATTVVGAELLEAKKGGNGKSRGKGRGRGNGGNGNGNGNGGNEDNVVICHCPPGNPENCHTIRVGSKAARAHLRNHPGDSEGPCDDDGQDQCLPVTDTLGNAEPASGGGFQLTTEGTLGSGNLVFDVPEGTTFGELSSLQSTFDFAEGTCAAGSPRFVVFLENGRCPYAAFPPGGDCADGEGSTGELVGNDTPFVWNDNLCGGTGNTTSTYTQVLGFYEDEPIDRIELVVDESGGETDVTVDPCITVADEDD